MKTIILKLLGAGLIGFLIFVATGNLPKKAEIEKKVETVGAWINDDKPVVIDEIDVELSTTTLLGATTTIISSFGGILKCEKE